MTKRDTWMDAKLRSRGYPYHTPWRRWYAWRPVVNASAGGTWWRPWTLRWLWLCECGHRETKYGRVPLNCYESQYVPWHVAVAHIMSEGDSECLTD